MQNVIKLLLNNAVGFMVLTTYLSLMARDSRCISLTILNANMVRIYAQWLPAKVTALHSRVNFKCIMVQHV